MIKIKVSDLQASLSASQVLASAKAPFKVSYDISKRLKAIDKELKEIDESRVNLIKELSAGKMKEDGINFDLGDNMPEFVKQYQEILDSEIELDILPLNTDNLAKANIEISAGHLSALSFLLEEPKAEENANS